jgi:hypothetical protein
MTEAVTIARPPVARAAVSRRRSAKLATVSASALALHLDCSRNYIGNVEAEGIILQRLPLLPAGSGPRLARMCLSKCLLSVVMAITRRWCVILESKRGHSGGERVEPVCRTGDLDGQFAG